MSEEFEYDYKRFDLIIERMLNAMWRDPDELEIGENISDLPEVKIIFDGYGDLETEDEYVERGNKNMESYAIFIHKDSKQEDFEFPEHDMTPWALVHRPREEICIYAWYDVENETWDILPLEDRIDEVNMTLEEIMDILEYLNEKHFESDDDSVEITNDPAAWPFATAKKE
jgi:hypothetical protein